MHSIIARFYIFGESLNPAELTDFLKTTPDNVSLLGDPIGSTRLVAKTNVWGIVSQTPPSEDLIKHLDHLQSRIMQNLKSFKHVCGEYESEFSIELTLDPSEDISLPAVYFEQSFNKLVAELNSEIDIDLYIR